MLDVVNGNLKVHENRHTVRILLDIDGTITHAPDFFKMLSILFSPTAEIHVVTGRDYENDLDYTLNELNELGIKYHQLAFTQNKLLYAIEQGINIVFEDSDEYFIHMPEHIVCFKIRELHNFCWDSMKWVYDDNTGRHIEDLT